MISDSCENRLRLLGLLVLLITGVLLARVGYLQVYQGEYYSRLADGNRIRIIPSMAPRGNFYDRNGQSIISNRPGFTVSLLPLVSPISPEVVARLSTLLRIPAAEIQAKIDSHVGFEPIRIKTDITPQTLAIVEEQKSLYPGVVIEVQAVRNYLYNEVGAHVLGYVSEISENELEQKKELGYKTGDIIGQFGLERLYDKQLRGENGGRQVEVDVNGKPVQILGTKDVAPGNDLILTLDWNLQLAAERAIDEHLKLIHAHAAAAVVMNPQTGEILAMVSRPAFNPNLFSTGISEKNWRTINENEYHPLDNKAITGEYPPGSTFKIVTGAAALTEKVVDVQEKFFDSGVYWLGEKGNAAGEALGWLDFKKALAYSDNVYFYEMGYRLGIDRLEKYARMFGLGAKTGVNLPYESEGLVACQAYKKRVFNDDWYTSETLDAAIGQGFNLVTPLQAAVVMAQIATNGKRYQPYVVKQIRDDAGNVVQAFEPKLLSTLDVPPEVIADIQAGLHDVTRIGTGAIFDRNYPIDLAGKTGTAENPHGRDHGWFVAYGPYKDPRVVVSVIVENGGYGTVAAAPIAKKIVEAVFQLK